MRRGAQCGEAELTGYLAIWLGFSTGRADMLFARQVGAAGWRGRATAAAQLLDPPAASQGAEARYRYRLQCFVDSGFL